MTTLLGRRELLAATALMSATALAPIVKAADKAPINARAARKAITIKGLTREKPAHRVPTTTDFLTQYPPPGSPPPAAAATKAVPGVYVKNGKYSPDGSKTASVTSGKLGETYASGIRISAAEGGSGGVFATGLGQEYVLANADIELSGDGQERVMAGPGSGVAVDDYAALTIRNCRITTRGIQRNATAAQNYGVLRVYNSTLTAHGAPFTVDKTSTGQKRQLEIDGNCRCHIGQSNSYNYFYYSTIVAEGWAALSMDMAAGFAYLEANHCTVKTIKSGYGTYADPGCHNHFNSCNFDVADMAAIVSGESDVAFLNTDAKCGTYFLMIHNVGQPQQVSVVSVTGGTVACKSAAIRVKSGNADVHFDGVSIHSENGILMESVVSTDPVAAKAANTKGMDVYGIHATLRNMTVSGDIIHTADKDNRGMTIYLQTTVLTGTIRDAAVSLDHTSRWFATADSYVTLVGDVEVSQLDAPAGVTITVVAAQAGTHKLASSGTLVVRTA